MLPRENYAHGKGAEEVGYPEPTPATQPLRVLLTLASLTEIRQLTHIGPYVLYCFFKSRL